MPSAEREPPSLSGRPMESNRRARNIVKTVLYVAGMAACSAVMVYAVCIYATLAWLSAAAPSPETLARIQREAWFWIATFVGALTLGVSLFVGLCRSGRDRTDGTPVDRAK
jgi:hypothetical protein